MHTVNLKGNRVIKSNILISVQELLIFANRLINFLKKNT